MLFGFVGSGKSTLARTLESELGAVRFSPNEWLVALYGTNPPAELFDEYHQRIARWMEVQYSRVLAVGIDIILETAVKADENDVDVQKQAGF
jgi:predicted kinase